MWVVMLQRSFSDVVSFGDNTKKAEMTDDSCIVEFIKIVPRDRI